MNDSKLEEMRRARGIYLLPNVFTVTALFAGFYSIAIAMHRHFDNAAIAIFVAMIMDNLDGRIARLTNTETAFGAQLDSLSDMIAFGVAPALVVYSWSLYNLGNAGWLTSFVFMVAVALRLARFNTQLHKSDKRYFQGLSSPAGAGIIASVVWLGHEYQIDGEKIGLFVAPLTVIVGLLMVSNIRYRSFKDFDLKGRVPFVALLVLILIFVLISFSPPEVLFLGFVLYGLSGPVTWLWFMRKKYKFRKERALKRLEKNHHENL
ncbi:MAG: CDP-diacylglycerol--serine O-phosphatidyltransferase [Gammaproteobacteria bacterium]